MRAKFLSSGAGAVAFGMALMAAGSTVSAFPAVPSEQNTQAPTAAAFARRPAISGVSIARDGKHIVALLSRGGQDRTVAVWKADDLAAPPYQIGTDTRSEIVSVQFIKNDRIFVTTKQLSDFDIMGQAEKSYRYRTQILDLEGNPARISLTFDGLSREQQSFIGVGSLLSSLPNDPQSILVTDPLKGDIYKINLVTGTSERVQRGSDRHNVSMTDIDGDARVRSEMNFEDGAVYIATSLKDSQGQWAEHFRSYARDRKGVSVVGLSNNPDIIFVSQVAEGSDHEAIYEYSISARKLGEVAFAHPVFNTGGLIRSSSSHDYGEIIGFSYQGERSRTVWIDERLEQISNLANRALNVVENSIIWNDISTGDAKRFGVIIGANAEIISSNDDRDRVIIRKSGPDTPPEYYIYQNGRLALLGRSYPELSAFRLGDMQLIQYKARDGLDIPAFLTKPDASVFGAGPYPAIVVPHGGPWSRDNADWDPTGWAQYFATRGYVVIQPQFRGSEGWGQKLWRAGDRQWGLAMQDDLDDAVAYMIAEGFTSTGQVAIHGYSYGGYAAMAASTRSNPVFRCAIAGAGPATIDLFKKSTYQNRYLREFQHPTAAGVDPLRLVANISMPVYLYTGDRDTNVIPAESRNFAAAMERAGKQVKLDILPEMEHSLGTWTPTNTARILTSVEAFLKDQCGLPGAPVI